jgi:hypothetical protein
MLAIDIDSDLVVAARKLPIGIRPQLLAVTGKHPTLRGHLWIGVTPNRDLDLVDEVLSRMVHLCGGDMAARGRARVMRLAGTVSRPSRAKRCRGYVTELVSGHAFDAPTYDLDALARALPCRPSRAKPPQSIRRTSASAALIEVSSALHWLPDRYSQDHDLWLRVGFALHDFDPGPRGLELWKAFSMRCPEKAAETNFERRWQTFGRPASRRITIRWLYAEALRVGWSGCRTLRRGKV